MSRRTKRENRICLLSMDHVLAEDIQTRISEDYRLTGADVVVPQTANGVITPENVLKITKETVSARVLILDVRSLTLPRLQEVYNRASGYNRWDFNRGCYTIVLGDGIPEFPSPDVGVESFRKEFAKFRIDYSPVTFYFDPFIHFRRAERMELYSEKIERCFERIPSGMGRVFKEPVSNLSKVRAYFRASTPNVRGSSAVKHAREEKLKRVMTKMIRERFPSQKKDLLAAMSKDGCPLDGETLPLNVYPFFFEERISDLLIKARA
jgi:hypothetical protein